ncbi:hypothetical protein BDW59DRAFT_149695 [Aspergillus cavernicola]|uniref:Uncharacterized protein n=1 Tax=Aspergillus cavernicola TaxID=176166 RepID=A0ABR4I316_9EURO
MVLARGGLSSVLGVPNILGELAVVKLRREASSQEPNLRHFLGHHNVFKKCVLATQESTAKPAFSKNHTPATSSKLRRTPETTSTPIRSHFTVAFKGIFRRHQASPSASKDNNLTCVQA